MAEERLERKRFTHIRLANWRNFAEVNVDLQRRVFLIGPNASGKSNFLDVLRFLHDIVAVGGGFQEAVRRRGGVASLRCLAVPSHSDVAVNVSIGDEKNPRAWEYEIHFNHEKKSKRPIINRERVAREGREILLRPNKKDREDRERLTQTHLEQVLANREFREVAELFSTVRYLHIVPQLVRDPERSIGRRNDPFGGDFLEKIANTSAKTRKAHLERIRSALAMAIPQLEQLEFYRDDNGIPHLRGKYEHWRPRGAWQNEGQFSDGTLRLIGLLWAALDGTGPLLLEEPELSLNPEVVKYIPQMFARLQRRYARQILISTHSGDMLLDEGMGLDEVLVLQPRDDGTSIRAAFEFLEIKSLIEGGKNLADAVMPLTSPEDAHQLSLFAD